MTRLKFKRHFKLVLALALAAMVLVAGAGDEPIVAYSMQDRGQMAGPVITYSYSLAALAETAANNIQVPGTVPGTGANISE